MEDVRERRWEMYEKRDGRCKRKEMGNVRERRWEMYEKGDGRCKRKE